MKQLAYAAFASRPVAKPACAISPWRRHPAATSHRPASSKAGPAADVARRSESHAGDRTKPDAGNPSVNKSKQPGSKTMAQLDEELRLRLEGMSGEGGAAGVEYERGRAEGLKSEVKRNMFRII